MGKLLNEPIAPQRSFMSSSRAPDSFLDANLAPVPVRRTPAH
jgi:hypothetical protein